MNKEQGTENILSVYALATHQDIADGIAWYRNARLFCRKMARKYNVSLDVAIACLSALSPRNKWGNNLLNVEEVLKACKEGRSPESVSVGTFHHNKNKAFRIVNENLPSLAKTSNKTASFFDNIRNVESEAVTVDIHAFSVFMGFRAEPSNLTDTHYNTMVAAYREAAKQVGLRPYELQAVCWIAWKKHSAKHRVRKLSSLHYATAQEMFLVAA